MQENNFETIISTWRRMSGEIIEPATVSMSGDSPDYQPYKKKEEEINLLVPEKSKQSAVPIAGTAAAAADTLENNAAAGPDEKQGLIRYESEESKEAAGDTNDKDVKTDKDYLENNTLVTPKTPESKQKPEKHGDKVDSVYLRPPPPHKTRSTASTVEEEDCGIKCLYYTLQCCDCVLM